MTLHFSRARVLTLFTAVCTLGATAVLAQSHSPRVRFDEMDVNHDGVISRSEWRGTDRDFRAYDVNGDGVVTWREMTPNGRSADRQGDHDQQSARDQENARARETRAAESNQPARETSRAFEAGRQRGQEEGRQAGLEDSYRRRWDLDGQQELESADSGYRSDFGSLEEFQAGYREAFMTAYRAAFGANAPRHGTAYRAGQTRGVADGREAGREDASRNHWDLEGQQELLLADAGYNVELGSRSDYQEGYRAGFRQGYSDGYARR